MTEKERNASKFLDNKSSDSMDDGSVEENKVTKSGDNESPVMKYIPKSFRTTTKDSKRETSIFRLIRLDTNALNNCSSYSQIIILVTSFFIILVVALHTCDDGSSNKDNMSTQPSTFNKKKAFFDSDSNDNSTLANVTAQTTEASSVTEMSSTTLSSTLSSTLVSTLTTNATTLELEDRPVSSTSAQLDRPREEKVGQDSDRIKCKVQLYFLIVCIFACSVELFSLTFYLYHFIEAFSNIPWLTMECIFYSIMTIQFLIMSVWMVTIGKWFGFTAFLGFVDTFLFVILSVSKIKRRMSGKPAQRTNNDPDGNLLRLRSPNYKFKKGEPNPQIDSKKSDTLKDLF